jgi:NAD(P)-dependent dehydrogenase (short-subunit alcohol dehydrogenase family)
MQITCHAMSNGLAGRSALVTGASQGLGLEISRHYVDAGANVFICAREADALDQARAELATRARDDRRVGAQVADVSNPGEVEALAQTAIAQFPDLSVLVNNAGIYGPKGPIEDVAWDEWVHAIAINLMGSVLPVRALVPQFKRIGYGKVIQLSGGGATSPLPGLSAYAASKTAVIRFAETLALELRPHNVDVNAIAPGAMNTRMLDEVLEAGPERVGDAYYERALEQQRSGGAPPENAARLAVWLASPESDGISGKLISAVWDPWRELARHREELDSDIYTLRRVVPADRGLDWGEVAD